MQMGEIATGPDGVDRRIIIDHEDEVITIWGLFDGHVDNCACDLSLLKRTIQVIKDDPTARVVIGGDFNDQMFAPGDPRFDMNNISGWLLRKQADFNDGVKAKDKKDEVRQKQVYWGRLLVDYNCALLAPIRDKIDVYISGNHEEKFARRHTINVAEDTAHALGVPFFPYESWLSYFIQPSWKEGGSRQVDGLVYHGAGGGGPVTGGRIDMTRVMTGWKPDFTMRGHNHTNDEGDTGYFERRGNFGYSRNYFRPVAQVNCPSFEKCYVPGKVTYGKERRMRPAPLGASCLYLNIGHVAANGLKITPSIKRGVPRG